MSCQGLVHVAHSSSLLENRLQKAGMERMEGWKWWNGIVFLTKLLLLGEFWKIFCWYKLHFFIRTTCILFVVVNRWCIGALFIGADLPDVLPKESSQNLELHSLKLTWHWKSPFSIGVVHLHSWWIFQPSHLSFRGARKPPSEKALQIQKIDSWLVLNPHLVATLCSPFRIGKMATSETLMTARQDQHIPEMDLFIENNRKETWTWGLLPSVTWGSRWATVQKTRPVPDTFNYNYWLFKNEILMSWLMK